MKRATLGACLCACALAGVASALALSAAPAAALFTTGTTPEPVGTTTAAGTLPRAGTATTSPGPPRGGTPPQPQTPELLPAGVTIGGVDVGGLTPSAAQAAVRTAFDAPLVLVVADRKLTVSPTNVGGVAGISNAVERARRAGSGTAVRLVVSVEVSKVRRFVRRLAARVDRRPVDATLSLRGVSPWISEDRPGLALHRRAAVRAIVEAIGTDPRAPITMRTEVRRARVTRANFGPVIVIHRGSYALRLYNGMRLRQAFGVAVGQAVYPTPLGRFRVVVKWRNPWWFPPASPWARGSAPIPPGPSNPLGTRWMGLNVNGVGIHGTYKSGSIGYSASHGCIRMRIPHAEWLFDRVPIGTPVFIVRS